MQTKAIICFVACCSLIGSGATAASELGKPTELALSVGAEPTNDENAHWQVFDDGGENVFACVLDGSSWHGQGDYTWFYNSTPIDLTQITHDGEPVLEFDYEIEDTVDTSLDIYLCSQEPTNSTILTAGQHVLSPYYEYDFARVTLDDSISTAYIAFLWTSGGQVDDGPLIDDIRIGERHWCDGEEIWFETDDQSLGGEEVEISFPSIHSEIRLGFFYTDEGRSEAWYWAIDNVNIFASGWPIWYENFENGDPNWEQHQYTGDGQWEHRYTGDVPIGGMHDHYYSADDSNDGEDYDYYVVCYTPVIQEHLRYGKPDTVYFDSNFQDYAGDGMCAVYFYYYVMTPFLEDDCDSMNNWSTVDEGNSHIQPTSWGAIKALD